MPINSNNTLESIALETNRSYITSLQAPEDRVNDVLSSRYDASQGHQDTDACVNRYHVPFDPSLAHFLQWIVYSRNVSAETKEVEKRTCPLLWCRKVYPNVQELVSHVPRCPGLSTGEYWCPLCSKPEFLCELYKEPPSHGLSNEELRLNLIIRAKKILSMLGIDSHPELKEINTPWSCELGHESFRELDENHSFPEFFKSDTFPGLAAMKPYNRSLEMPSIQPCQQFREDFQFSRVRNSYRPINNPWQMPQISSPIPPLRTNWETSTASLPPRRPSVYEWSSSSLVSQSRFRHESVEEPILPANSMDCPINSHLGPASLPANKNFDENEWRSSSGLFQSLNSVDLIKLFWDVLEEHVSISKTKIAQLHEISNVRRLIAMSSKAVAREGLHTLQLILGGKEPTTLLEIYALAHIAYTSLVIFGGCGVDNLRKIFVSLFELGTALKSNMEMEIFPKVANAVWSVPIKAYSAIDTSAIHQSLHPQSFISTNCLIQACTHFLDLTERSRPVDLYPPSSLQPSLKTAPCPNEEFRIIVKLDITVPLMSTPSLECFIKNVASVEKRLEEGYINDIRQLELELIWVSKMSSQSELLYNRFLSIVFQTCSTAYKRLFHHTLSRTDYHLQDIQVVLETISSILEPPHESMKTQPKQWSTRDTPSPISFTSLSSRASSPCDSFSSPSFTFSPPASMTFSNNSSFSSVRSTMAQSSHSSSIQSFTSPSGTKILKCPICGYEPAYSSGISKWKPGNLKRHMRSTHNGKRYECSFEGCGKVFIGRKDNLLSHQRDKGHLLPAPSPFTAFEDDFVIEDM